MLKFLKKKEIIIKSRDINVQHLENSLIDKIGLKFLFLTKKIIWRLQLKLNIKI